MSLPRLRVTIAIAAIVSVVLSVPGFARHSRRMPGSERGVSVCFSERSPPETRLSACTAALASGRFEGRQLASILDARGTVYGTAGDYDHALADFSSAIQADPTYWVSFYSRGVAYARQDKFESALGDLTEAQRLAPDVAETSAATAALRSRLAARTRGPSQESGDLKALQQRLASDGCYQGAADGQPSAALDAAVKACPSQDPILRIETGSHVAKILGLAVDPACRIMATASFDKTTRIWSVKDRHLLRTFRVPIGNGTGGDGYTAAISPDGRYVATAGADAQLDVTGRSFAYVFDAASGALVARVLGFDSAVDNVAFSPDGRWFAVAGGTVQSGVRVYDTSDWHPAMSDLSYGDKDVDALAFGFDGSLYAAGFDGRLRRYGPGPRFPMEQDVAIPGGSQPGTIAADPRGEFVVVGFDDSRALSLFDAATLRFRFFADTSGINGILGAVTWAADGQRLFAGGQYSLASKAGAPTAILTFDRNGRRIGEVGGPNNTIQQMRACGSGLALSGNGFGLLDGAGTLDWSSLAAIDMRGKVGSAFTISADAKRVRFGLGFAAESSPTDAPIVDPVVFDLSQGTLGAAPNAIDGFIAPLTSTLPITRGPAGIPMIGGRLLIDPSRAEAHGLAIEPDRSGFVFGTNTDLRAYTAERSELWEVPGHGEAWGVNLSADGRIVVAAYDDGTIRWHRWSDGKELLALFVDKADKRWVAWTPKGYYTASPGGEDLIGWHVNRGWDQAAEFFPASRFRARFNRPDIVRLVLDTLDEEQAIKQANAAAGRTEDAQPLIAHLPPLIRILDPAPGTRVASGAASIGYAFRSPSGLPVDRIVVTINGRPVKEVGLPVRALSGDQETTGTVNLTLGTRESDIGLIAWSGELASQVAHVTLTWEGAPATTSAMRKLYVLVAGVSAYADPDMRLDFAAKDAADFAKALEAQKGVYYGDVETRVLTDGQVSRASLTQGLDWLNTVATSPDDVSILFLAGHGLTDAKGTYWFFPADANADDMGQKGVSQEEIRRSLQGLKGKVLWFLDTCHAGAAATRAPADMNVLLNTVTAAESGGIVVFASSTGREVSIESKDLGNGAFTKALVEGIEQGKAAFLHALITTSSLDGFVESRVKELTGDKQTPVMERPPQEPDFTIAQAPR